MSALLLALVVAAVPDEVFRPTTSGPFITFTAPLTTPQRLLLQPIFTVSSTETTRSDALTLFSEYGISKRFSFGGQAQLIGNHASVGEVSAAHVAFGDAFIFSRAVLWFERGQSLLPETTAIVQLKFPTGSPPPGRAGSLDTSVTGTGSVDGTFGFDFTKGFAPVLVHLDVLGTLAGPSERSGAPYRYGPMLNWSCSVEWPIADGRYALMGEVSGRHRAAGSGLGEQELSIGAGLELIATETVQALAGAQRTVWSENVPVTTHVVVTVVPTF